MSKSNLIGPWRRIEQSSLDIAVYESDVRHQLCLMGYGMCFKHPSGGGYGLPSHTAPTHYTMRE